MKTKWFRVATSGKTIDGREITPALIDQVAASYDPAKYGARIWMEHYRSLLPDSPFKAYGDVLALKAEDAGDGQRALFAQVDATQELMETAAKRQKVFWSIEVDTNFAQTGQAYMVGLAVTDSPASLSTEMIQFSLKSDKAPATAKAHLFSTQVEAPLQAEEAPDTGGATFLAKFKELLSGKPGTERVAQLETAVTTLAGEFGALKTAIGAFSAGAPPDATLSGRVDKIAADLAELTTKLSSTSPTTPRPPASGGNGATATDC